ncbi:MAG: hypothetical protein M1839_003518 [Geoglossum umbratile]|nr:MAG: hypothetical protein M1839_003518 [Geoglossum umbratile]
MHPVVLGAELSAINITLIVVAAYLVWGTWRCVFNLYFHPLAAFPGPFAARATTWWRTYVELVQQESMCVRCKALHKKYGEIIRIGPNELHFSRPSVYHDIYNNNARWDKEETLYHSFGEDQSSFGFLTYAESARRKAILNPLFSRRRIINMQSLIQDKIGALCAALRAQSDAGVPSDLFLGFRCYTIDTITSFCFARSVNAIDEPEFKAPIIEAMIATLPTLVVFKHFKLVKWMILNCPPWLSVILNPELVGLVRLQELLGGQVKEVSKNPSLLQDTPYPIIYHHLLDPDAHKGQSIPSPSSLYEEAQALLYGGTDTVANALTIGVFHILEKPEILQKLKEELLAAWPEMEQTPKFEDLEKLSYLSAVIKESLRVTPGVASSLLRVVPPSGTTLCGAAIPGGTIVGMSSMFVHNDETIFPEPEEFSPDRWLGPDSKALEKWLVAFSRGPRSCLGINLAYCELYIGLANVLRRFDFELYETRSSDLAWRECFIPHYTGRHLQAFCRPAA